MGISSYYANFSAICCAGGLYVSSSALLLSSLIYRRLFAFAFGCMISSDSDSSEENGSRSFISTFSFDFSSNLGFTSIISFFYVNDETGTFFPKERLCCGYFSTGFFV